MSGADGSDEITITQAQARFVSWVSEVLLDIVVLNLFVEYVHTIVIDSFAISVLTALLMKLAIDAVKGLEHRVASYFRAKQGLIWRALGLLSVFSILFLSKFVILELVNIVFGDHVELGHFIEVVAIILTMLAGNALLQLVFRQLGRHDDGTLRWAGVLAALRELEGRHDERSAELSAPEVSGDVQDARPGRRPTKEVFCALSR